jgi:hypothetical protein
VNLASRGLRDLDTGAENVTDAVERAALKQQASRVLLKSVAAGLALTALTFIVR